MDKYASYVMSKTTSWSVAKSKKYLNAPKKSDHKYRRGVLGCVTGSKQFPGAALLTTESALATGVGMVRYFGPEKVKRAVIQNRPEVVLVSGRVDVYLLGSGIPESGALFRKLMMEQINRTKVPRILDAGALYLAGTSKALTLITPHAGELLKLFASKKIEVSISDIEKDPGSWAQKCAKLFGVTVLIKGSTTYVANENRIIKLPIATSWLATAGTGDVLAGVIGALIAINHENLNEENLIEIAATGSLVHAMAAKRASSKSKNGPIDIGQMVMTISTIIGQISAR